MSDNDSSLNNLKCIDPACVVDIGDLVNEGQICLNTIEITGHVCTYHHECNEEWLRVKVEYYIVRNGDWDTKLKKIYLPSDLVKFLKNGIYIEHPDNGKIPNDCDRYEYEEFYDEIPVGIKFSGNVFTEIINNVENQLFTTIPEPSILTSVYTSIGISFGFITSPEIEDVDYNLYVGFNFNEVLGDGVISLNNSQNVILERDGSMRNDNWCKH